MSNSELVSYITKGLADGHSRAEIEAALKQAGWPVADISAAFGGTPPAGGPANGASADKLPGTLALLAVAWQTYTTRFGSLLGLMLLPLLAFVGLAFVFIFVVGLSVGVSALASFTNPAQAVSFFGGQGILTLGAWLFFVLAFLVAILIQSWMQVALIYAVRGSDFSDALKQSLNTMLGYYWVMLLAGVITLGAFGFFAVPGFIASVWFLFAGYVFLVENKPGLAALWQSKALVSGRWWGIFGRVLLFGLIIGVPLLALSLAFGKDSPLQGIVQLISFIITPLQIAFLNALYDAARQRPAAAKPSKPLLIMTIIGYLLLALSVAGLIRMFMVSQPITDQQKQELQKLLQKELPSGINQLNPDPLQPPNGDVAPVPQVQ